MNNRVIKNHHDVTARALPVVPRGDGLDGYRVNAPDIEWTLPSGRTYLSTPVPAPGLGSQPDAATTAQATPPPTPPTTPPTTPPSER